MLTVEHFNAESIDTIVQFQHAIIPQAHWWSRDEAVSTLTDRAHGGGEQVWVAWRGDEVVGLRRYVVGADEEKQFYASPFVGRDPEAIHSLVARTLLRAREVRADWIRIGTLITESEKIAVLSKAGFRRAFDFIEFFRSPTEEAESAALKSLRRLSASEIDPHQFAEFHNLCFKGADNAPPISDEQVAEMWSSPATWQEVSQLWVDSAGRTVGFLNASRGGCIEAVAVAPHFRNRGLAQAMIRKALSEAARSGLARVTAVISANNKPAIKLHQRLGFCEAGRRTIWQLDL